jgi:hypothetical protein
MWASKPWLRRAAYTALGTQVMEATIMDAPA